MPEDTTAPMTRDMKIALAAMTIAASMILVDQTAVPLATPRAVNDLGGSLDESQWLLTANILPLAALMILGGRVGDLFGLRRVFLAGAVVFGLATMFAATAQTMEWMIAARVVQGCGAALMMPTSIAIVSSVFPLERRGWSLGVVAAARRPSPPSARARRAARLDRLAAVFVLNLMLAILVVGLTVRSVPDLRPDPDAPRRVDLPGAALLALALAGLVFGLAQGRSRAGATWSRGAVIAGALLLVASASSSCATAVPLVEFRLFRNLNLVAANISQAIAGMIELGLGFLLPSFLLLVVGVSPAVAGHRADPRRCGSCWPGGSPAALRLLRRPLAAGRGLSRARRLGPGARARGRRRVRHRAIPGLVLQGIGLGVVLTVNDPTGLTAVSDDDQGAAAGMINTSEQLGGAIGIACCSPSSWASARPAVRAARQRGIDPTPAQNEAGKEFIYEAEQVGLERAVEEWRGSQRSASSWRPRRRAHHGSPPPTALGGLALVAAR